MTLRNASGKFSLPFGRKSNDSSQPRQSSSTYSSGGQTQSLAPQDAEPPTSPMAPEPTSAGSAPGEGFGSKLGKKIAHTSLMPSLGNQDLRELQDVITAEKAVMGTTDRLSHEVRTAAVKLPGYCKEGKEGPDLQDVLGHSSTLLAQLADALQVFSGRESQMRECFKRIRAREELLEESRRKRRTTATKAEAAEKKLAKMGPENKALYQQTELLERLRSEMRQMDSDIVHEESRIGDFKRQTVKEAMSYKFGGLEELGEKMCIIGELGKLLLEEIPLEETPPGYGRAPYTAYERTAGTTQEALKCLSTVHFHAASTEPKPPGLPGLQQSGTLTPPHFPRQDSADQRQSLAHASVAESAVAEREAYGDYPPGEMSPPGARGASLGAGALLGAGASHAPQLPPVEHQEYDHEHDHEHDYEYQQQREMDEQREAANGGWQPLRVSHSREHGGTTLRDGPASAVLQDAPPRGASLQDNGPTSSQTSPSLNLNSDAFEPLSFERTVPSRTSAYYSPDPNREENQTPVPPFAAAQQPGTTEEFRTPRSSPPPVHDASAAYDGVGIDSPTDEDGYRHSRPFSHLPSPSQIHDEELPAPPPVPSLPPAVETHERAVTPPAYAPPHAAPTAPTAPTVTIPADTTAYADDQESTPVVSIPAERAPDRYVPPVAPPAPELDPTASLVSDERDSFLASSRGSLAPSIATSAPSHYTRESAPSQYTRDSYAPTHDSHDSAASNGTATDIPDVPVVSIPAERTFQPPAKLNGGKISAAAFRRGPRSSSGLTDDYDPSSPTSATSPLGPRRLPQPPAPTQQAAVPSTPSPRSSWDEDARPEHDLR